MRHSRLKQQEAHELPDTRQRLIDSTARVLSGEPSASLARLARAAGVGRATLHRHFASREALLRAAAHDGLRRLDAALAALDPKRRPAAAGLEALVDTLVPHGQRLHFLLVTPELRGDARLRRLEARIDARLAQHFEAFTQAGLLRADVPQAWLFAALEALLYAAWSAVARGELAAREAPGLLHETLLRGFGTANARAPRARA
jgi:AcrR family transcriptional regulator